MPIQQVRLCVFAVVNRKFWICGHEVAAPVQVVVAAGGGAPPSVISAAALLTSSQPSHSTNPKRPPETTPRIVPPTVLFPPAFGFCSTDLPSQLLQRTNSCGIASSLEEHSYVSASTAPVHKVREHSRRSVCFKECEAEGHVLRRASGQDSVCFPCPALCPALPCPALPPPVPCPALPCSAGPVFCPALLARHCAACASFAMPCHIILDPPVSFCPP